MPNTPSDGGSAVGTPRRPRGQADPVHKAIPVPLHWQEEEKASIDRDVKLGVLEAVPIGPGAIEWSRLGRKTASHDAQWTCMCSANMLSVKHITPNPRFYRRRWYLQGPRRQFPMLGTGIIVSPIRKQDRHFTTFITPWGRYRYKTCPQGYAASQDGYTRRLDEVVTDFPNKSKCIDDTCLWADTLEESFFQTCHWLDICGRHGIVQNFKKFVFGSDAVEFFGFVITPTKIQPSGKHIRAIRDFPTSQNITDIRSLFGFINQVSYCDSLRNDMAPFCEHLKPSSTFY